LTLRTSCFNNINVENLTPLKGISMKNERIISIIGLGYVGLPVAVAFGKVRRTVGFDINQLNLLAATTTDSEAVNQLYNTAANERTSLNELFYKLQTRLLPQYHFLHDCKPIYRDFRKVDALHSQADISKAANLLGYAPTHNIDTGLDSALPWYIEKLLTLISKI